ncbi:hypothetical protein, partial [Nonomuraea lactucae]|uniref:hypothetical protein n=1 Tax=Nonomuraea lactucae TaxID=2249762 RepID=UPI001964B221
APQAAEAGAALWRERAAADGSLAAADGSLSDVDTARLFAGLSARLRAVHEAETAAIARLAALTG